MELPKAIAQAEARLDGDRAALRKLVNGPTQYDLASARLAVNEAKDKLYVDQTYYDYQVSKQQASDPQKQAGLIADKLAIDQAINALARITAPARDEDLAVAQAAVSAGQQTVALARQPYRPEEIAQFEQAVVASQGQLDQAQHQADASALSAARTARPFTVYDVAEARATVDHAQATLRGAQNARLDATVTAPASGTIRDLPIIVGLLVGRSDPIATLISDDLQIVINVEETQIGKVREGQAVTVTTPTGSEVPGEIFQIALALDPKTGGFPVKVRPFNASGLRLGMSVKVAVDSSGASR